MRGTSVVWIDFEGLVVTLHGLLVFALLGQPDALLNTTIRRRRRVSATQPRSIIAIGVSSAPRTFRWPIERSATHAAFRSLRP